jgi:hypothetical protein
MFSFNSEAIPLIIVVISIFSAVHIGTSDKTTWKVLLRNISP